MGSCIKENNVQFEMWSSGKSEELPSLKRFKQKELEKLSV
jgi:hypothetical protein